MSEHVSTERMNELLDGAVAAAEREGLDGHLESCAACRNEYARLSEVVRAVGTLPRDAAVPEGVWAAIASRIASGAAGTPDVEEAEVLALPTRMRERTTHRISFSVPELAAAAAVVALLSASMVWLVMSGGGQESLAGPAVASVEEPGGAAARAVFLTDDRYTAVTEQLETVLAQGRSMLTEETLATIEESLATIDGAIAEVEAALMEDPNSDLLQRMLVNQRQTRLGVLQRAADAVQAQT